MTENNETYKRDLCGDFDDRNIMTTATRKLQLEERKKPQQTIETMHEKIDMKCYLAENNW